jgi:hypothetical protein
VARVTVSASDIVQNGSAYMQAVNDDVEELGPA